MRAAEEAPRKAPRADAGSAVDSVSRSGSLSRARFARRRVSLKKLRHVNICLKQQSRKKLTDVA